MTEERPYTLVLSGDAGIKSAQNLAASLAQAIQDHPQVAIDTQTVSEADVTTVQTLLAARRTAESAGRDLTMLAPLGRKLNDVLAQAGFLSPDQDHRAFWCATTDPLRPLQT